MVYSREIYNCIIFNLPEKLHVDKKHLQLHFAEKRDIDKLSHSSLPYMAHAKFGDFNSSTSSLPFPSRQSSTCSSDSFSEDTNLGASALPIPHAQPRKRKTPRNKAHRRRARIKPYGSARYPEFETASSRFKSFENFPHSLEVSIEQLVTDGFYHLGESDKVQCFVCGLILFNWSIDYKPREEHQRFSPNCRYLQILRENPKALIQVSDLPAVKAVSELGYSLQQAEDSYNSLLQSGQNSPHAADLLDFIFAHPELSSTTEEEEEEEDLYSADQPNTNGYAERSDDERVSDDDGDDDGGDDSPYLEVDIQKAHMQEAETKKLKTKLEELELQGKCRGCLEKKADMVNLPCGHLATCETCVYKYTTCRICDRLIRGIVKVYMV